MHRSRWLVLLLAGVTVVSLSVTVWAVFFRKPSAILAPDYAPVEREQHAQPIPDDTSAQESSPQGGGSVSLSYSSQVIVDLPSGTASLYFANPGASNQDMLLQLVAQGTLLLQSGTLPPGHQISQLPLSEDTLSLLAPGGYEGKLVISYYDPATGERAVVNTEIPVTITVYE